MTQTPETWARVTAAFDQAVGLGESERDSFLYKLQVDDPAVGKEVASLLGFHDGADAGFLEEPIGPKLAKALIEKDTPSFRDGDAVGDFRILNLLGAGSFAKVYLAHQVSLERQVALKVSSDVGHEALTMAHLEHDNIVRVFSQTSDPQAGTRMICMQYVPGCTLEKILEAAREMNTSLTGEHLLAIVDEHTTSAAIFNPAALKDRQALTRLDAVGAGIWFGIRLADALEYAHKKGVLHLDIKPGNILVTPYGRPLLTDFNVSIRARIDDVEEPKLLGGTLTYMAPEHRSAFDGDLKAFERIDGRADVYSLATVLQQMLAPALAEQTEFSGLSRVLQKATAPAIENRYRSAAEFSRALGACLEQRAIVAQLPPPSRLIRAATHRPMWVLGVMVLFPQSIASTVNIIYNHSRIVARLTPSQEAFFHELCYYWNPLVFGVCIYMLVRSQLDIHRFTVAPEKWVARGPQSLAQIRRQILNYPFRITVITTLGWATAALLFPLALDVFVGPVQSWVYHHFFISFFLSWMIALTYSFLFAQYIGVRVVYPTAWQGCADVRLTAREELKAVGPRMRFFHCLAGFIPLVGALVLIFFDVGGGTSGEDAVYRLLLLLLITAGMAGFFFALRASDQLSRTLYALTGSEEW